MSRSTEKIVNTPIAYSIEYRQYRRRNPSSCHVRESIPMAFPVPGEDHASPAFFITPYEKPKQERYTHIPDAQRIHVMPKFPYTIHLYEDKLMRPAFIDGGLEPLTPEYLDDFPGLPQDRGSSDKYRDYPFIADHTNPLSCPTRNQVEHDIHEFYSDTRDEAVAAAHTTLRDLAIIEDCINKPVLEPFFEVIPFGATMQNGKLSHGVIVRVLTQGIEEAERDSALFSANDRDKAIALAEEFASRYNEKLHFDGDIEVLNPDAVHFDPAEINRQRLIEQMKSMMTSGFGSKTPTDVVRIWCDAYDIVQDPLADPDHIQRAVLEFCDRYQGFSRFRRPAIQMLAQHITPMISDLDQESIAALSL